MKRLKMSQQQLQQHQGRRKQEEIDAEKELEIVLKISQQGYTIDGKQLQPQHLNEKEQKVSNNNNNNEKQMNQPEQLTNHEGNNEDEAEFDTNEYQVEKFTERQQTDSQEQNELDMEPSLYSNPLGWFSKKLFKNSKNTTEKQINLLSKSNNKNQNNELVENKKIEHFDKLYQVLQSEYNVKTTNQQTDNVITDNIRETYQENEENQQAEQEFQDLQEKLKAGISPQGFESLAKKGTNIHNIANSYEDDSEEENKSAQKQETQKKKKNVTSIKQSLRFKKSIKDKSIANQPKNLSKTSSNKQNFNFMNMLKKNPEQQQYEQLQEFQYELQEKSPVPNSNKNIINKQNNNELLNRINPFKKKEDSADEEYNEINDDMNDLNLSGLIDSSDDSKNSQEQ